MLPTNMSQDTGKFRQNTKDQFYTKASIATKCVNTILTRCPETITYQWTEPSAGNGAFLKAVPSNILCSGLDIEPKAAEIEQADFLKWTPSTTNTPRIFFGNPPFGRQSSAAKAFIKHASAFASIIAFILPKSFVKPSMNRVFPLHFHCIHSEELPTNSFEVNGQAYDVPCVFQIWKKQTTERVLEQPIEPAGFQYVKHTEPFHIAVRRVGVNAGRAHPSGNYANQSHYFIQLNEQHISRIQAIIEKINEHTFPSNTVGPRSLSKSEVNSVLNRLLQSS
jgi:hypothetical protein